MKKYICFFAATIALCGCSSPKGPANIEGVDTPLLKDGKIYFGSYPQAAVTQEETLDKLNKAAGTPDTSNQWKYLDNVANYKDILENYYVDVEIDNAKYRGLYFESYRPFMTSKEATEENTYQKKNGVELKKAYWFAYSSIEWTILKNKETGYTLLSSSILDSDAFQTNKVVPVDEKNPIYANNYALSTVREKLNGHFYESAFSEIAAPYIKETTIDNSVDSTDSEKNPYVCEDTKDKVYLLSYQDVANSDLGFNEEHGVSDPFRLGYATDYAKCLGCKVYADYGNSSEWWTRTPSRDDGNYARLVDYEGYADVSLICSWSAAGLRPAIRINK